MTAGAIVLAYIGIGMLSVLGLHAFVEPWKEYSYSTCKSKPTDGWWFFTFWVFVIWPLVAPITFGVVYGRHLREKFLKEWDDAEGS